MTLGDNYIIFYKNHDKRILATFYQEANGIYYFRDISGIFGVSKKAVESGAIELLLAED